MIGSLVADRYRIDAPLGAGGMGTVYRASDVRLGRSVALKLLAPELGGDAEAIARFEREARACASLTHPGIVQIHDFGSTPSPTGRGRASYLVMELVEGETLAHRMRRGALPLGEALAMGREILDALAAAHAMGIVHRDLKPENVMLVRDARGATHVKLLDFGLAQIKAGTAYQRLTQTGAILGTPRYMSPEQARSLPCDPRTDVYAAGLVLYAAICGRAPFDAENVAALVAQVLEATPPPLDATVPGVPGGVSAAIATAMSKDPPRRFASAQAFASALEQAEASTKARVPAAYAPTLGAPPPAPTLGAPPPAPAPAPAPPVATQPMPMPAAAPMPMPAPVPVPAHAPPPSGSRLGVGVVIGGLGVMVIGLAAALAFVLVERPEPPSPTAAPAPSEAPSPSLAPATAVPTPIASEVPVPTSVPTPTHVHAPHPSTAPASSVVPTTTTPPSTTSLSPPPVPSAAPPPTPVPATTTAPPPPVTTTSGVPLRPVCALAVHCCELVGGDHETCASHAAGDPSTTPGGNERACTLIVGSYHDALVTMHRDTASECVWPRP